MNGDLQALPEDWCVYRDGAEWAVGKLNDDIGCGGQYVAWLASASTISEAITAAHARLEREEREYAERRADYERRKAAGQLTPLELAGEYTSALMARQVLDMVASQTAITRLLNRGFESADIAIEDTIKINKVEFKA